MNAAWWWVRVYTSIVPSGVRDRRREELAAHFADAHSAGVPTREVARATWRGAWNDLRWCREERIHAGRPPVVLSTLGSTVLAGLAMTLTYVCSLFSRRPELIMVLPKCSAALLVVSFADGARRRRTRPPAGEMDSNILD